ncbi:MAG: HU family DNA-binding protein [Pseudomonadota bacterium]
MARATTTKKKTTSTTSRTTRTSPAKAAAAAAKGVTTTTSAPAATPDAAAAPRDVKPALRRKQLIEQVADASGMKKPQVRAVVDETLRILGETLAKGDQMNIEPLGKLRVMRERDLPGSHVYTCKVRRKKPDPVAPTGTDAPLAEAAE